MTANVKVWMPPGQRFLFREEASEFEVTDRDWTAKLPELISVGLAAQPNVEEVRQEYETFVPLDEPTKVSFVFPSNMRVTVNGRRIKTHDAVLLANRGLLTALEKSLAKWKTNEQPSNCLPLTYLIQSLV